MSLDQTPLLGPQHPLGLHVIVGMARGGVPSSFDLLHFQSEPCVSLTCGLGCQPEPAQDIPPHPPDREEPTSAGESVPVGNKARCLVLKVPKLWLCEVQGPLHDSWLGTELDEGFCLPRYPVEGSAHRRPSIRVLCMSKEMPGSKEERP